MPKAPIIDFHIHPIVYDTYQNSAIEWIKGVIEKNQEFDMFYQRYSEPEQLVKLLKDSGIDYGVVMAEISPITTGICTNEYVADYCRDKPELLPFASLNPNVDYNIAKKLEKLVLVDGFKGLKIYPTYQHIYPNDRRLYPVYAAAQELKIPVMVHTGSSIFKGAKLKYGDPIHLDDVAVDFPELNLLLVHGGRGFWYDKAYFLAKIHQNVYLEIAGLPPNNLLQYFPDLGRIAHKVIYGSDWPGVPDLAQNLQSLKNLPLTQQQIDMILGRNALKLLHL